MRWTMGALLLVALDAGAQAPQLYKCVGRDGAVSFQSAPCPDTARIARIYASAPESGPDRPAAANIYRAGPQATRPAARSENASTDARGAQRARCLLARRHREATLQQVGLARTFDLLRQLDNLVFEACKGL